MENTKGTSKTGPDKKKVSHFKMKKTVLPDTPSTAEVICP
jgi:hypothetical protein